MVGAVGLSNFNIVIRLTDRFRNGVEAKKELIEIQGRKLFDEKCEASGGK